MKEEFLGFMRDELVPCANRILRTKYESYCAGADVGVETKADGTPAGQADRETEAALRKLIEARYPDHGIWGEEYDAVRLDSEWLWVLDPLDGTREFLSKNPGCFGALIGLFYRGKAMLGAISDPLSEKLWIARTDERITLAATGKSLKDSIVACTNPGTMFTTPEEQDFINKIRGDARAFIEKLNCMGFAKLAAGEIDAVIEADLSLHDLGALIPVLQSAGKTVIDFEGNDYAAQKFNLAAAQGQKFNVIAAKNKALAQSILDRRPEL